MSRKLYGLRPDPITRLGRRYVTSDWWWEQVWAVSFDLLNGLKFATPAFRANMLLGYDAKTGERCVVKGKEAYWMAGRLLKAIVVVLKAGKQFEIPDLDPANEVPLEGIAKDSTPYVQERDNELFTRNIIEFAYFLEHCGGFVSGLPDWLFRSRKFACETCKKEATGVHAGYAFCEDHLREQEQNGEYNVMWQHGEDKQPRCEQCPRVDKCNATNNEACSIKN